MVESVLLVRVRATAAAVLIALPSAVHAESAAGGPAGPVVVVARVNGHAVTRPELERLVADPAQRPSLQQQAGAGSDRRALERVALAQLVNRRLLVEEALRRGEAVTEEELDEAVTALRRRFSDLAEFGRWMKAQQLDDRMLFGVLRDDLLAARARAALVGDVRVTPEEERLYYEDQRGSLRIEEVRLQLIVVRERQEGVRLLEAAIEKREDFGRLAREHSIGLRAGQGGDTGWVESSALAPALREAISGLPPRTATGPIPRGDTFIVVRLHDRRPGRAMTFEEARPTIARRLLAAREREAVNGWLEARRRAAVVDVLP